jgi:tellurite resistance protein TehA-like permease
MNETVQTFLSPVALLIRATLFAILFTVILTTLRRAKFFPPRASFTLAICASLLAVIGILRALAGTENGATNASNGSLPDALLLPYTAMGIAMPLVLLLLLLRNVISGRGRALRRANRHIRSRNRQSSDAEHKHRQGDAEDQLAKE